MALNGRGAPSFFAYSRLSGVTMKALSAVDSPPCTQYQLETSYEIKSCIKALTIFLSHTCKARMHIWNSITGQVGSLS